MEKYNHINIIFIIVLKKLRYVFNFNNILRINIIFIIIMKKFKYFTESFKI